MLIIMAYDKMSYFLCAASSVVLRLSLRGGGAGAKDQPCEVKCNKGGCSVTLACDQGEKCRNAKW